MKKSRDYSDYRWFEISDKLIAMDRNNDLRGINKWLWNHFINPDLAYPKNLRVPQMEKMRKVAETDKAAEFNKRALAIATRLGITSQEVILRYFRTLDYYTRTKDDRPADDQEMVRLREQLKELFGGMSMETLDVVGRPYFFERGWWGGWKVNTYEEMEEEIAKGSTHLTYDRTSFLYNAGFEHCWDM